MISEKEFKTIKPGDNLVVYDFNEKKEISGTVESLGGYCVLVKTAKENQIYYKEEIIKKITIILVCFLLTSCAKTYNCECNLLDHNSGNIRTTSYGINDKKEAAIAKCNGGDEYSTSYSKDCNITNQ